MKKLAMRRNQYWTLAQCQARARQDWHAVFSTNYIAQLWPFKRWGSTPLPDRIELHDVPTILLTIASEYLKIRPEGGRFFISHAGAFYKLDLFGMAVEQQFLAFELLD